MAMFGVSSTLSRLVVPPVRPACGKPLRNIFPILSCSLSGKIYREKKPKPPPFDYKNKRFTLWASFFDSTTARFDENSKVVIVEGPLAVGKTKFAKELAEELDMLHIKEANMDLRYINPYGYDMRQLDPQLPESVQSYDEKTFCKNPFHVNSAAFQMWMYQLRFSVYVDALAHVLSTGQGVVLERSPWSDMVFMEAMVGSKFMSKEAKFTYGEVKRSTIHQLMRPHLVIYLDIPVKTVKENIKKRGLPHEQNSKALTDKFLQDIEDLYKTQYLAEISEHAELLVYDWSEGGDVEAIVEDIERLDFDKYTKHDKKMFDWWLPYEDMWSIKRRLYADQKYQLSSLFNVPVLDAPELWVDGEDIKIWKKLWYSAPGMKYSPGFNPEQGDKGLLFKNPWKKEYIPY